MKGFCIIKRIIPIFILCFSLIMAGCADKVTDDGQDKAEEAASEETTTAADIAASSKGAMSAGSGRVMNTTSLTKEMISAISAKTDDSSMFSDDTEAGDAADMNAEGEDTEETVSENSPGE